VDLLPINQRVILFEEALFKQELANISDARLQALRGEIDAPKGAPIGLFCGSLYHGKRLDYMIAAADIIHAALPAFRLVVIGGGPSAHTIENAVLTRPWLKWMGARIGPDKACWFKLADVVINPGMVGLHILDSFCSAAPMITVADSKHGPEIVYLRNGKNGLIVKGGPDRYAKAVVELFNDRERLEVIKKIALEDSKRLTLDNMVNQFANGIERCLSMPKK
jgi:glycosyltransferase involved in cell wall biosynthesis